MPDQTTTLVRAKGVLDVDLGAVLEGASVLVEGNRITSVTDAPRSTSDVDLVLGGPGAGLSDPVRMDPVKKDGTVVKRTGP